MSPGDSQELVENPFLQKLLSLQQDGSAAISAPTNWASPPVLRIETELDSVVSELFEGILAGMRQREIAKWHFFVGSPGNGKSANTGELARRLLDAGFSVKDADDRDLAALPVGNIPYVLQVFEPGQPFACALIAQDASVVPDPYAEDANPATSLWKLLERAANKGLSLVVCTNRGVLERTFSAHYLQKECTGKVWFDAVKASVLGQSGFQRKFDGDARKVFSSVSFSYTNLDRRSLLVGRQTFEQLVEQAVDDRHWLPCGRCPARDRCPFFQNRRWFQDRDLRQSYVGIIRQAEILSGQIVVFREALALISLTLAGCPHDYPDGSPCRWVHTRLAQRDYFSLLSRRLYMTLFSSYAPLGLEPFAADRTDQREALRKLLDSVTGPGAEDCRRSVRHVVNADTVISSDVGIERMVGSQGILRSIDPFSDIREKQFHDHWDDEGEKPFGGLGTWLSELERTCSGIWDLLKDAAESRSDTWGDAYRWLSRWITAFTHRAGGLVTGAVTFREEIQQLVKLLSLSEQPDDEGMRLFEQIESELWQMLHGEGEGTQISAFGRLKGEWVEMKLKPKIGRGEPAGEQTIVPQLKFGDSTRIPMNALAFVWLKRRVDRAMSNACFPLKYLETAGDALVRAASESGYYCQDSGIELVISLRGDKKASLKRRDGRVIVDGL